MTSRYYNPKKLERRLQEREKQRLAQGREENVPRSYPLMSKKLMIFFGVIAIAIVYGYYDWFSGDQKEDVSEKTQEEILVEQRVITTTREEKSDSSVPVEAHDGKEIVRYTVAEEDIPSDIFQTYGRMSFDDVEKLLVASEDVYDFTNVKIGKEFRFIFDGERLDHIEYVRDTESLVVAQKTDDGFDVHQEDIAYDVEVVTVRGTIENSLYADAVAQGMQERTVAQMSEILAFDVNFFTDIQAGNSFVVHFEKRTLNRQEGPDGRIFAARFINDEGTHDAYSFDDGEGLAFYDGDGHELRKQFLQAPLSYSRISSGFTGARLHPVTGRTSPHYQVDYVAPTGTPVIATANGVVTSAGWEGGWGRIVRVRHDNGYTTHYAHLSGIAKGARAGAGVDQGQVVGFVGSTGWSTGPHLDYGMRLGGAPVNPLTLKQPKGNPLASDKLDEFKNSIEQYKALLEK